MDERQGLPSASGIERLALCPGSFRLERGQPDTSSAESESGTRIHDYLHMGGVVLSDAELEVAESIQTLINKMLVQWAGEDYTRACEYREERIFIEDLDGFAFASGKFDYLAILGNKGLVIDAKTGRGDVQDPRENLQLRALAVAVAGKHQLTEVTVGIAQPLATMEPAMCCYGPEDLRRAYFELRAITDSARQDDAPLNPGDEQCKYCKAALICPARKAQVEQLAITTIHETGLTVSNQDLVALLDKCGPAAKMIATIKAEAFRRAEEDPEAWRELGFEIVTPKGRGEISDLPAVTKKLNTLGVPWEDISARCKMPKGAVKELLRPVAKAQGLTLKDAEWSVLKDNCTQKPGKPKLARIGAGDDEEEE